ncbi:MAG TPA: hypothetical protein VMV80_08350, partial [Anaerolineales bacterium]|nr:hypothetical protein [Anaerolineales bacterium]
MFKKNNKSMAHVVSKYYKFLTEDNYGEYSGFDFTEYLPNGDEPGPWLPEVEQLELCELGYHACTSNQLLNWCNAQLWEVEYKNEPEQHYNKVNGHCIRFVRKIDTWNYRTARLFAVWCAREALKLVDEPDPRSVEACNVAERYANGEATKEELVAARYAAGYAAWDAARTAARAAARDAAWFAARDAAMAAAWY